MTTKEQQQDERAPVKTMTMDLTVEIGQEERNDFARRHSLIASEIDDAQAKMVAEVKSTKERHQAIVGELTDQCRRCRRIANTGRDIRPVECEEFHDYKAGKATVVRMDTGELVMERTLTKDETQRRLTVVEMADQRNAKRSRKADAAGDENPL